MVNNNVQNNFMKLEKNNKKRMECDLNRSIVSYSVSSVLNRDVKQYGKKFLFDKKDDTCWNSDQVSSFF